jgi:CheY-like chemotaxis protein
VKILFVDDEQRILEGIERTLFSLDDECEAEFALSGDNALELLQQGTFDVIVSDMRMPGMDGAQLLSAVRKRYPQMIRVILSGQSEEEAALRAVPVAHQFLSKPCRVQTLLADLQRIIQYRDQVPSESLRAFVGGLNALPSLPRLSAALCSLLCQRESHPSEMIDIVSEDPAMIAKLSQLANSAFFCRSESVFEVNGAAAKLGARLLNTLACDLSIFVAAQNLRHTEVLERLSNLAVRRAKIIASLLSGTSSVKGCVLAAQLMDVGELILTACEGAPDSESSAEAGAYLLALWNLPESVVELVARARRAPRELPVQLRAAATALHFADQKAIDPHADNSWFRDANLAGLLAQWKSQEP